MGTRHVVAMPYPGRGHINPMMNLCKSLSSRLNNDVLITVVVTEEWLGLIGSEPKPDTIRFVTIPNVLPSELGRAADMVGFIEAILTKIEEPFDRILDRLEGPAPDVIVADTFLPWAVDVGRRRNIPVASFWPMTGTVFSMFYYYDLVAQNRQFPVDLPEREEVTVDNIPGLSPFRLSDLPSLYHLQNQTLLKKVVQEVTSKAPRADYLLISSILELEPQTIDSLQATFPFPVYTLGPLIPYFNLHRDSPRPTTTLNGTNNVDYLRWLDSQPHSSVLYVSLGSFLSVSSAQMDEIAAGLKTSGVKYLLVAREKASSMKESVCGGSGVVVPWCDQLKVLCHPAIGGFWTHCGWNSTMESFFAGLPLLALPLSLDQFPNTTLVTEGLKIGWRVKRPARDGIRSPVTKCPSSYDGEEHEPSRNRRSEIVSDLVRREEIAELVRRFMDPENVERKEMEKRAREVQETCRRAVGKGGSSENNFEAFMKEIFPDQ